MLCYHSFSVQDNTKDDPPLKNISFTFVFLFFLFSFCCLIIVSQSETTRSQIKSDLICLCLVLPLFFFFFLVILIFFFSNDLCEFDYVYIKPIKSTTLGHIIQTISPAQEDGNISQVYLTGLNANSQVCVCLTQACCCSLPASISPWIDSSWCAVQCSALLAIQQRSPGDSVYTMFWKWGL